MRQRVKELLDPIVAELNVGGMAAHDVVGYFNCPSWAG